MWHVELNVPQFQMLTRPRPHLPPRAQFHSISSSSFGKFAKIIRWNSSLWRPPLGNPESVTVNCTSQCWRSFFKWNCTDVGWNSLSNPISLDQCEWTLRRGWFTKKVFHIISFESISKKPTSKSFHEPSVKSVRNWQIFGGKSAENYIS